MAHFAELDNKNKVIQVLVVSNEDCNGGNFPESETYGIDFLEKLFGHRNWKQTSYNGKFRGTFAGPGFKYNSTEDCFIFPVIEKTLLEIAEEETYNYSTGGTQN